MPDDPKNSDSLDDDRTFVGERDTPLKSEQSLGDQATAGDALSSISDNSGPANELGDEMPLVDLSERYEILDVLGKGGMGEVLRATDTRLDRPVAIKRVLGEMARSTKALSRFLTEAKSIAALNHFNIVQIYDYGRDTDGPFIIMELVEGKSLYEKLKDGPLEFKEAIDLTCQLCDALGKAHGAGIIHRDIKPANILLTEDGVPKLTDFGLARQDSVDHGQTQAGAVLGTIDFMPPEQRRDATAVDPRSDLWSLAATLYQMITGKSPKVIRLDQLPANLAPVIGTMLEEDPEERFQTAGEFKAELRKSMAAAAAPVAVDLAAGVCPACNTANDSSRKFCRECGDSLRVPCLACKADVPVWENICGECGSKQDEQRELIRDKLAATIEEGLTLAREYEFEKALEQLNTVAKDPHAFNEDLRGQAAEQVTLVTAEWDQQNQLRDQLVQLANQHQQAHDYAAAARELEKIPAPLRSGNPIAEQLSHAQAARDELSSLLQEISSDIKNKRFDGLMEKTTRVLELNPKHDQVQKLHEQLLERQQQADDQAAELLGRAEQQYSQYEDEAVLTTVANWPQALQQPARAFQLQKMATDRLGRVQQLKKQIATETIADRKLSLVEEYMLLRPGDGQAGKIAEGLRQQIQQIQEEKQRQRQAERKRQQIKKMIIAGSTLAGVLLLLVTGLWIRSSYKAEAVAAVERVAAERVAADRESARLADIKAEADRVAADRESARLADIKAEADRVAAARAADSGDTNPPVDPVETPPAASKGTPLKDVPRELAFAMEKRGQKKAIRLSGIGVDTLRVFPLGSEEPVGFDGRELKVSLLCPVLDPPKSGKPLDKTPFHLVKTGSADSGKKWELKWRLDDSVDTIGTLEFTKLNESGRQLEFHWNDEIDTTQLSSPNPEIHQMGIFDLLQGCIVQLSHGDQRRHVFFSLRDPKPDNAIDFAVERLFTDTPVIPLLTDVTPLQGDHIRAKFDVITLVSGKTTLKPQLESEHVETAILSMGQKAENQKVDSGVTNYEFNILIKPQGAAGPDKMIEEKPAEARLLIDIRSDGQPLTLKVATRVILPNPYAGDKNLEVNGKVLSENHELNGKVLSETDFKKLKAPGPKLATFKSFRASDRDRFHNAKSQELRLRMMVAVDPRFKRQHEQAKKAHDKYLEICSQQQKFWLAHQTLRAFVEMGPPKVFANSPVIFLEREYLDSASGDPAQTQWIEITRTTWLSP